MLRPRSTPLIAAVLLTSLAGCASGSLVDATRPVSRGEAKEKRQAALAPACPTPTPDSKAAKIATYIERAKPDPNLDVFATEWERLDDGARACRTGKAPPPNP